MNKLRRSGLTERTQSILQKDETSPRLQALRELREQMPLEMLEAVVALLNSPDQKVRRRAGGALSFFKLNGADLEAKAAVLAEHLRSHEDERVRLSCAIVLMSVPGTCVDDAFLAALADPSEKVVQIACLEVRDRKGTEGTATLFGMLGHPSWRVRLEVCKALIVQKTADARVVATLEAMSHDPEAAKYDAEVDESEEFVKEFTASLSPDGTPDENWGKLGTILVKARGIAGSSEMNRTANE